MGMVTFSELQSLQRERGQFLGASKLTYVVKSEC